MKKMVLVLVLAAIALSGSAFAQDPAYLDNIGIYADDAATTGCVTWADGAHPAYLVLTKMTQNEVLGWELKLTVENMFMTSFALRGEGLDVAQRDNEHMVGLNTPLPAVNGQVVLADLEFVLAPYALGDPSYAFIDEVYFSLLENGLPAYLNGANEGFPMHQANAYNPGWTGSVGVPVFIVNGDCNTVANEDLSFGSVKSLFR